MPTYPVQSAQEPTGTWRHPRFDEINRRVQATTFNDQNVKSIVRHALLLLLLVSLPTLARLSGISSLLAGLSSLPYSQHYLLCISTVPLFSIAHALSPLFKSKDDLSDIPLTPKQRALLGLAPTNKPATPGSQYITPPRYARSATPRSSGGSLAGSPQSGRPSSAASGTIGTPYSPSASPLVLKAKNRDITRRLSYGSQSSLSLSKLPSESSSSFAASSLVPSTPSPSARVTSVPLNSRWLYERSRSSSGTRNMY